MNIRPTPGAHFRVSRRLVPAASTAAGILWAFRNPGKGEQKLFAMVTGIRLHVLQVGNPTAAVEDRFSLTVVRNYAKADDKGGVNVSPPALKQKMRSNQANSGITLHESNTAAGLTGGQGQLDPSPISLNSVWVASTMAAVAAATVFDLAIDTSKGEHPLVLETNEGFVIRNDNPLGAASGIVVLFGVHWFEADYY